MNKKISILGFAGLLALPVLVHVDKNNIEDFFDNDNVTYANNISVDYANPAYVDDGEETIPDVEKVTLHYHNDDGKCGSDTTTTGVSGGRSFYFWANGVEGKEFFPDEVSNNGMDMVITIDMTSDTYAFISGKSSLLFIIKYRSDAGPGTNTNNWDGQSANIELIYSEYTIKDKAIEVWTVPAVGGGISIFNTEAESKVDGVKYAEFIDWKTIKCVSSAASVSYSVYAFDETYYKINASSRESYKRWYLILEGTGSGSSFNITLPHKAHINMVYNIVSLDSNSTTGLTKSTNVVYDKLYDDSRFETYYTYDGNDLGMTYSSSETTFKVWAPTAANMTLKLYDSDTSSDYGGSDRAKSYHMFYQPGGIWAITIKGDLAGKYYCYFVDNTNFNSLVMDPYATAAGTNGVRSMIYDKNATNPDGWDNLPLKWDKQTGYDISSPQDLSIYEVHVSDFTYDETWISHENNRNGTYNAFVESGTTYTQDGVTVSTGYDHLNELGVKAVQLLPVFDHDNDERLETNTFNWGYNPLNYNCVEGAYSSDPSNALVRIKEYKNMILQLSKTNAHTRVIMDVVYNHVSSASSCNFTKLMPKYYFRYTEEGEYYDGSGCSNEVRTEATMMRKFIVDSVTMWATEYKVKGFRFDLMELIDTVTMKAIATALYAIDPDIVIYGEGWTAAGFHGKGTGTSTAHAYSDLYRTSTSIPVGAFNDAGRDALRGKNDPTYGYMSQGAEDASSENASKVSDMLLGFHTGKGGNPEQTINYASCHDNFTVYDQMYYTLGSNGTAPSTKVVMESSVAIHSFVMLSNGVAFMQGGEELFRSKELDENALEKVAASTYIDIYGHKISHNSYNAPAYINAFDWSRKISVDGIDTTGYVQKIAQAIAKRSTIRKYSYDDRNHLYAGGTTTAGKHIDNVYWAGKNKANADYYGACGFQMDEYFFFLGGRNWSYISFTDVKGEPLFSFNLDRYDQGNGTVNIGNYDNNYGCGLAVWYRG